MLRACLALCRLPARKEKQFSEWRATFDAFGLVYAWFCFLVPHTYWILKASVCPNDITHVSFSESIRQDPVFSSFPCSPAALNHTQGMPMVLFNSFNMLTNEPPQSTQWFYDNFQWAVPYIWTFHTLSYGCAVMLSGPLIVLLWLLFPSWWVHGGRTLLILAWRSYAIVFVLAHELTHAGRKVNPMAFENALQWSFHNTLVKTVFGAVPLRLHVPYSVVETLATWYLPIVIYWSRRPGLFWMVKVFIASASGAVLGLSLAAVEQYSLEKLTATRRAADTDDTPMGPLFALKLAGAGGRKLWRAITATRQTVEFAVTAVVASVCVVVMAVTGNLVVVL